jgi:D-aspartate ligase
MATETLPVRPIILGGDIGAYGSARAFHEAFGIRSVVIAGVSTGAVAHSAIVDHRVVPGLEDPDVLVEAVRAAAAEAPAARAIVLASADWLVRTLVENRRRLEDVVVVPYSDRAALDVMTDKARFTELCAELGVPHPRTVVVRAADVRVLDLDLTYPVVVKAASTSDYHHFEFEGKKKVDLARDPTELERVFGRIAAAGFGGELVVQEYVPGGDDQMGAVNVMCWPDGVAAFALFGQVLLEEYTPGALGNSVAQVTGANAEAVAHARRLVEHVGWTGFANLDVKRDPRDGTYRFLELNPRVGRSGYSVTAAGYNVARMYVDAFVDRVPRPPFRAGDAEHVFVVVPLALVRRYVTGREWARVRSLRRAGRVTNPLYYRAERHPRRIVYVAVAMANQFRKFARYHPGLPPSPAV